jgi:predicted TPR repeat methyltransferase
MAVQGKPRSSLPADPIRALRARELLAEGRQLLDTGKVGEAARVSAELVRVAPMLAEGHQLMGTLAMRTNALDFAQGCFERALALNPRSADLHVALAQTLLAQHRPRDAAALLDQGRTIHPNDGRIFNELGQAQLDLDQPAAALKSFARALRINPRDLYASHMVAALEKSAASGNGYVAALFDSYADTFDEHLTGKLAYRVPEALAELIAARPGDNGPVLDIGCGTGLMASALPKNVSPIDGIDIAPKMIAKAEERGLYRHLCLGDAAAVLAADPDFAGPYALVTATDVFIYIGDFAALLALAAARLTPGGRIAFSVETHPGNGIAVRSSGRFAHAADYVRNLADASHLAILAEQPHPIRLEREQPIPGALYVLGRA